MQDIIQQGLTGHYSTGTKWGGASGLWRDAADFYLKNNGFVVYDNKIINHVNFQGNRITWVWPNNSCAADFTFKLGSTSRYFWSDDITDNVFEGALQSRLADGWIDFKCVIKPKQSQYQFIQSYSNGLIIDAEDTTGGTIVRLQQMDADMHPHFCVTGDGQINNMINKLALTVNSSSPTSGTLVKLSALEETNNVQIWQFVFDGHVQSAVNNNLVLAVASDNTSVVVIAKSGGTPNPKELWYGLYEQQFLYNGGLNRSVIEATGANEGTGTKANLRKTQEQQASSGILQALTLSAIKMGWSWEYKTVTKRPEHVSSCSECRQPIPNNSGP